MKRLFYLDRLRVLASFLVVLIHINIPYIYGQKNTNFYLASPYNLLAYIAVPIFFMVSGAIFLDKKYQAKNMKHRALKIILIYIIWSLVYGVINNFSAISSQTNQLQVLTTVLKSISIGSYHLWFLPELAVLYLITPYLRKLIHNLNSSEIKFLVKLFFVGIMCFNISTVVAEIDSFAWFNDLFNPFIKTFTLSAGYYVFGYFINNFKLPYKKILKYIAPIIFVIYLVVFYLLSSNDNKFFGVFENMSLSVFVISILVFDYFKDNLNNKANRLVDFLSENSFGVYILHAFFVNIISYFDLLSSLNIIIRVPILSILAYLCSLITFCWVKKIKTVRFITTI